MSCRRTVTSSFGTVALQSLKTARADPVEALRHVEC
jgi:hypothetical protein